MSRTRFDAESNVGDKMNNTNGDVDKSMPDGPDDGDETDDEEETLEESPCGQWLKRREEVHQRNVPGIDNAYLAMDSEEGVEVVWNEILFSEQDMADGRDTKLSKVFDSLIQLEHQNIVKFHKYWVHKAREPPRMVFISEFMSSGSLKQFMKKTKGNLKRLPLQSWKRWCTQIVSGLNYLHSRSPPIIHGNLSCDTIFIQHNGLIKIGSVSPDVMNEVAKTARDVGKNRHFVAPEYNRKDPSASITSAADIYSFGICALEMAVLEIQSLAASANGGQGAEGIPEDGVRLALETLSREEPLQFDFIQRCLRQDPADRASARELLFHPILFEVHSLKLLAAHKLAHNPDFSSECVTNEAIQQRYGKDKVLVELSRHGEVNSYRLPDFPAGQKLELFMEDVQFGMYPLTAFAVSQSEADLNQSHERAPSPSTDVSGRLGSCAASSSGMPAGGSVSAKCTDGLHLSLSRNDSFSSDVPPSRDMPGFEMETRRVLNMVCTMRTNANEGEPNGKTLNTPHDGPTRLTEDGSPFTLQLSILLRLEDKMNRQLVCDLKDDDTAESLASDLVRNCLIAKEDEAVVRGLIAEMMENLATGCTSSASAILDRTDIPASFFESGLMKDLIAAAAVTVGGIQSPQPAGRIQNALPNMAAATY